MRLACVQTNPKLGETAANAASVEARVRRLAADGVDLAIFPECALTGYAVATREAAREIAIPRDHETILRLDRIARESGIAIVVGFAEREDGRLFNTAALLGLEGGPRFYRKTHLPILGYDNFVELGDALPVFETTFGKIGVLICYDLRAPEAARTLALQGADLIVLPTNWPEGAEISADVLAVARAVENRVFLATCDRVGEENGFRFIGKSKIIAPNGRILASARDGEERITADIDLTEARQKRIVVRPGTYETETFLSRRPELYDALIKREDLS